MKSWLRNLQRKEPRRCIPQDAFIDNSINRALVKRPTQTIAYIESWSGGLHRVLIKRPTLKITHMESW